MEVKELVELLFDYEVDTGILMRLVLFDSGSVMLQCQTSDWMRRFENVDKLKQFIKEQKPPDYKSLFSVADGEFLKADFSGIEITSETDIPISVAKWEVMSDEMNKSGKIINDGSGMTCACCVLQSRRGIRGCTGCSIAEETGKYHCIDTPYRDYIKASDENDLYEAMKAAHAEVEFLKSLL